MAGRLLGLQFKRTICISAVRPNYVGSGFELTAEQKRKIYPKIGNRDIVGWGQKGMADYRDFPTKPCPAVRWMENTPEILALREKEKGDWKNLSLDEKKLLYRSNYRQTYAEMTAPVGEWKAIWAIALGLVSVGLLVSVYCKLVAEPHFKMPGNYGDDPIQYRNFLLRRQRDYGVGRISGHGPGRYWDYENDCWNDNWREQFSNPGQKRRF